MQTHTIVEKILSVGVMNAKNVDVTKIRTYPSLRELCSMNSCGHYATNWGCPPGCGEIEDLTIKIKGYKNGIVYQNIGGLEDSYDIEGMTKCAKDFSEITLNIKKIMAEQFSSFLVLGAGGCSVCESCTYPTSACRLPDKCNVSVEACGINVTQLCALAGLNYINGQNTVTNTGVILF